MVFSVLGMVSQDGYFQICGDEGLRGDAAIFCGDDLGVVDGCSYVDGGRFCFGGVRECGVCGSAVRGG